MPRWRRSRRNAADTRCSRLRPRRSATPTTRRKPAMGRLPFRCRWLARHPVDATQHSRHDRRKPWRAASATSPPDCPQTARRLLYESIENRQSRCGGAGQGRMNTDATSRYEELQGYVGWSEADAVRLVAVGDALQPFFASLIEDFYSEIARHREAQQVITGGEAQVARLKQTLRQWLTELFSGNYDSSYVARRWEAGHRHVEIGLNQLYANAALARLRRGLMAALEVCLVAEPHRLAAVREAVNMATGSEEPKVELPSMRHV